MDKNARILVAGHRGLVGSAIHRALEQGDWANLIVRGREETDLRDRTAVDRLFAAEKPEYVFLAAAKVGGILANSRQPAEFLFDNLAIELNVIDASWRHSVRKLQFLGSSCIYPRLAPQPIKEEYLLTGTLEPTNEAYAVAKIAGIKLCQSYRSQYGFNAISLMPTNLYGPGDNFDPESSHVLPALIRKVHEAKAIGAPEISIWGTGSPRREFLYVEDLADAAIFLMGVYDEPEIVNVGTGTDVTIKELAETVCDVIGFSGDLRFDRSMPDGTPRKLLDISRLRALGWSPRTTLQDGIAITYQWYLEQASMGPQHSHRVLETRMDRP